MFLPPKQILHNILVKMPFFKVKSLLCNILQRKIPFVPKELWESSSNILEPRFQNCKSKLKEKNWCSYFIYKIYGRSLIRQSQKCRIFAAANFSKRISRAQSVASMVFGRVNEPMSQVMRISLIGSLCDRFDDPSSTSRLNARLENCPRILPT